MLAYSHGNCIPAERGLHMHPPGPPAGQGSGRSIIFNDYKFPRQFVLFHTFPSFAFARLIETSEPLPNPRGLCQVNTEDSCVAYVVYPLACALHDWEDYRANQQQPMAESQHDGPGAGSIINYANYAASSM